MFQHVIDPNTNLRLFGARDAGPLFRLVDSERMSLREWLPWVDDTKTEKDSTQFIQNSLQKYANNGAFDAGIWVQDTLVGSVGFHPISWGNKNVSIGYWLAHGYRGRGIVSNSVRALTTLAFDSLTLHRVEIRCATTNLKSQNIPKRLGFNLEGTLRQSECLGDRFVDHHVFATLAHEWRNRVKSGS